MPEAVSDDEVPTESVHENLTTFDNTNPVFVEKAAESVNPLYQQEPESPHLFDDTEELKIAR